MTASNIQTFLTWLNRVHEQNFVTTFRLYHSEFATLCKETFRLKTKSSGWTNEVETMAFLLFMAQGMTIRMTAMTLEIPKSTVGDIINWHLQHVDHFSKRYINFPTDEKRIAEICDGFKLISKSNIICDAVGAMDGTLIRLENKYNKKPSFFCRKGFYALNTLLVVDHEGLIMYAYTGCRGSTHDSNMFKQSALFRKNLWPPPDTPSRKYYILADCGYQCMNSPTRVIVPYTIKQGKKH